MAGLNQPAHLWCGPRSPLRKGSSALRQGTRRVDEVDSEDEPEQLHEEIRHAAGQIDETLGRRLVDPPSRPVPRLGNLAPAREVVHHKDQLMVMVAVQDFDVDASLGHSAREQPELTGHVLLQPLNEHFLFGEDLDASRFQRPAGGSSVRKEEMSHALAAHDPSPSAFDADSSAAQSLSHIGESAGAVFQGDGQILHGAPQAVTDVLDGYPNRFAPQGSMTLHQLPPPTGRR